MSLNPNREISARHRINSAIDAAQFSGVDFLDVAKKMGIEGERQQRAVGQEMLETAIKLHSGEKQSDIRDTLQRRFQLDETQLEIAANAITQAVQGAPKGSPSTGLSR